MISKRESELIGCQVAIGSNGEFAKLRSFREVPGSKSETVVSLHSGRVDGITGIVIGLHRSAIPKWSRASFTVEGEGRSRLYFHLNIEALIELYSLMGDYIESLDRSEFGLDSLFENPVQ